MEPCLPACWTALLRCRLRCSGSLPWRSSGGGDTGRQVHASRSGHQRHAVCDSASINYCTFQPRETTKELTRRLPTLPDLRSLLAPVAPGDRPLCVLNTHLFFHYMAPHIRTMHVWAMVQASSAVAAMSWACSVWRVRRRRLGLLQAPTHVLGWGSMAGALLLLHLVSLCACRSSRLLPAMLLAGSPCPAAAVPNQPQALTNPHTLLRGMWPLHEAATSLRKRWSAHAACCCSAAPTLPCRRQHSSLRRRWLMLSWPRACSGDSARCCSSVEISTRVRGWLVGWPAA